MRTKYFPPFLGAVAFVASLSASMSYAAVYNQTHKNSSLVVDDTSGATAWFVDGVDHLAYQTYFYRLGPAGSESSIQSLGAPVVNTYVNAASQSVLDLTFAHANFTVRTVSILQGMSLGTGKASWTESLTVQNTSAAPLDLHFFQYSDFDLGGVLGGQTLQFLPNNLNNQFYKVQQTSGSIVLNSTISTASFPVGHVEAGLFAATANSLNDANPTTLNDATSAGPGDVTYAYQWDMILAPNESLQISKLTTIVPEPSSLSLAALAALALAVRKRALK
jgi:large repetitive protein